MRTTHTPTLTLENTARQIPQPDSVRRVGRPRKIQSKDNLMSDTAKLRVTKTVFDLASFDDVTLVKEFDAPAKVETVAAALERLGGDNAKLLEVINDGLLEHAKSSAKDDANIPWMQENDETSALETFSGEPVSDEVGKTINGLILNLAKSTFGYLKAAAAKDANGKKAAKQKAIDFVRNNDTIKQGIKESAGV